MEFNNIKEVLKENFPILKKTEENNVFWVNQDDELGLYIGNHAGEDIALTQQDCLELSQLFALLATAFEEVE